MTTVLATNAYKAAKEVKITKPSPLPVLNHALLTTEAGWLVITTAEMTDDGIKAKRAKIAARVTDEFSTCVPMYHKVIWDEFERGRGQVKHTITTHPFLDWLAVTHNPRKDAPDQIDLTLDEKTQTLKIKAGNTRAEFKCIDAQEFPAC
jgi:hypothetical protein